MTFCQYKCGTDLKPYDREDKKSPRYELDGTKHDYNRCMEVKNKSTARQEFTETVNKLEQKPIISNDAINVKLDKILEKLDMIDVHETENRELKQALAKASFTTGDKVNEK